MIEAPKQGGIAKTAFMGAIALALATPASASDVYVRDVDTIVVDGTAVRLQGVDGPETSNSAGRAARAWLIDWLAERPVECRLNGERTKDRWVGTCEADGQDIGAAAIRAGHANRCARYDQAGRYAGLPVNTALPRAPYC